MALPPPQTRNHVFAHPHERRQFEFFSALNHPHHGLVARVDVTALRGFASREQLGFNRAVVHAVSTAANAVAPLRRRIRHGEVVEHAVVHPSYAARTGVSEGFSFCEVAFDPDAAAFCSTAQRVETEVLANPSLADEPGRDDYLFLSAIPWVHFTGIQHAMGYHPADSVPRITWGKVIEDAGRHVMPLAAQAHHGVVDGAGLGAFYEAFEAYVAACGTGA